MSGICDKKVLLFMTAAVISNCSYIIIPAFLPLELEKKGVDAKSFGIIFAAYPVAVILFSPLIGKMVERCGVVCFLSLGLLLMGASFIGYALMDMMTSSNWILILSMMLRFIQGLASALIQTTNYSIIANDYATKMTRMVGIMEMMCGVGFLVGPLLAAVVYGWIDYLGTFLVYGGLNVGFAVVVCLCYPVKEPVAETEQPLIERGEEKEPVSYGALFSSVRFTFAGLSAGLGYFVYC
jgi:MFS family permease